MMWTKDMVEYRLVENEIHTYSSGPNNSVVLNKRGGWKISQN